MVKRGAVLLLIALLVLLPLYELVDIGEQWPHDGSVVLVLLSGLFLIGIAMLCRRLAHACLACLQRVPLPRPDRTFTIPAYFAFRSLQALLILIICLLRI